MQIRLSLNLRLSTIFVNVVYTVVPGSLNAHNVALKL